MKAWYDSRGIPWHSDNNFPKMYTIISHFSVKIWVMGLSLALISTVTIWTRCDPRFLSYSLGQLSEVSLQRCFRSQNSDIYSTKKSEQTCGLTNNESEILIMTFISWPWMTLIAWPWNLVYFIFLWPRVHLRFLIFIPQNTFLWCAFQGKKIKKVFSSNFCIYLV